jgi:amino acid transporter
LESDKKPVFVRNATGLTRQIGSSEAFLGNILAMGVCYFFVFAFFASFLLPGTNLPVTVLVTLVPGSIVAFLYYLFTVAMPRTGGDYIWTSRILHPSLGFVTNFLLTFTWLTSIATAVGWGITYGVAPMFAAIGLVENNTGLTSIASTLASPDTGFVLSAILIFLFIAPIFFGTKAAFRVMWGAFLVSLVGALVMVAAFYSANNATFMANFNTLSGMNYQAIITKAALPLGFTVSATLTGSIFTMTNFLGFFSSSYFSGEVKRVARSQVIAMFGSLIFLVVIAFLIYGSSYYSAGSDFMNAISLLCGTGNSACTLPVAPVLNYLVAFARPNSLVIALSGLGLLATGLGGATLFAFVCVRNLFAWSFDRITPEALTKLDSKRGAPYVSIIVIMILSVFFSAIYYFTQFFTYYVYATLNLFIVFVMVSIAAILFPYKLKGVFDSAPPIVNKKIGGFPVISLIGIIGVIVNAFFGYETVTPAITPAVSGGVLLQYLAYASVPITIIVGFAIYGVSYYYRKSKGVPLNKIFSEIPPE